MKATLKPCPFCGSHDIHLYAPKGCPEVSIRCRSCGVLLVGLEELFDRWNRRDGIDTPSMETHIAPLVSLLVGELTRASIAHPKWPTDAVHASAILNEEAGELTQAAIDFHFYVDDRERMREEAIQVGAMVLRFLMNLDGYKPEGGAV
ncbi:hypothetical protein SOASR030_37480 [Leminorella grimontii]|uniref:Restriction alleviation protein, Lar family n=1 Tax=Leminorella grimontii TaxID=82981 RepID=A0AAV5N6A8_9GAMM|nr:hypothetical protein [Leminorella grimontii]KFC92470.1 hypothetical protein GLGR_3800 [Leminorella grimontii ATCC 33999 = DSM 5078]GKX57636.1 hypothetical protein SOASR030_37480 [Leminorella grimontii]VFS55867.1 restriction alleviation protein, Lar family [Leminorella grimontii]